MTDLDLEAIKTRANALEAAMDNDAADYDPDVWDMCVNLQDLIEEVEACRAHKEYLSDKLKMNIRIRRDLQAKTRITDAKIERAALAIAEVDEWPTNEELGGGPTSTRDDEFRDEHIDMARAALEAALGGGQG